MPRMFWVALLGMLAAWSTMNFWTAPRIEELSGGSPLLDKRLTGYSFTEAHSFLAAIGEEGVSLYLGWQLWLDTIFPPLLGAVLFLSYRGLFPGLPGLATGMLSMVYVVVDYLENFAISAMLRAGPDALTPEMVATAHRWTIAKWSLALCGLVTLIAGVVLRRRIKPR